MDTYFNNSLLNNSNTYSEKFPTNNDIYNQFINETRFLINKYSDHKNEKFDSKLTVIILYSIIAFISIFGNLLVCFVIMKNKTMRTKTNILMANITISGLMMTVFNIPFNIARILLEDWPFGVVLCKLVPAMQVTLVYVLYNKLVYIILFDNYY